MSLYLKSLQTSSYHATFSSSCLPPLSHITKGCVNTCSQAHRVIFLCFFYATMCITVTVPDKVYLSTERCELEHEAVNDDIFVHEVEGLSPGYKHALLCNIG